MLCSCHPIHVTQGLSIGFSPVSRVAGRELHLDHSNEAPLGFVASACDGGGCTEFRRGFFELIFTSARNAAATKVWFYIFPRLGLRGYFRERSARSSEAFEVVQDSESDFTPASGIG